ncbi:hypothetical protein DYB35_005284 [Aphanomyces astaci]|uniref:Cilia- and flagella-associated protein 58 central coiled coil domain-containing protein n=1 Tax=Aphanomyces astaci TaxID=112090 RepID=A0A3R6WLK6_APHAT|nr:hypothetical protein DYB35_005284 [Aphanomyces astaci]
MAAFLPTIPEEMGLFRQEVEKMLNALVKSQESEQRLLRRTREIVGEIGTNQDKYAREKEEELEAYNYKKKVQVDIEVMWGQVANSHKLETEKQAKLNELRTNIAMLEEQLKNGSGWSEAQEEMMAKLKRQRSDSAREVETKANELAQIRMEVASLQALVNEAEEEQFRLEEELANVSNEVQEKRSKADKESRRKVMLEKSLKTLKHEAETFNAEWKRKADAVKVNKMLVRAADTAQGTHDLTKIKENTMKNLENEINGYRQSVKQQRDMVQQLVSERDRYDKEAEVANRKYRAAVEEAKLQDLQVTSLQDKITEGETRLKQQQNLYEAVRSDRNLYSKSLIESQEEIADMKRKFKIMNHQIEQLKEEITTKDHCLVKEHFDHHKDKETLKAELTRIKKQIQSSEQIIANQEQEISKLASIIQEADDEKQRQMKEYNAVINDRDNLRAQLILRKYRFEELKALYEKIKIQKSTLSIGQVQYLERVKDVQHLQKRVQDLMDEHKKTQNQIACTGDLKAELLRLEGDLLQERTKIKALSEV